MSNYVKKRGEVISMDIRKIISTRYHMITSAINKEFWNSDSETDNSFYVGSYGRGTAIDSSDIDILVVLPEKEYLHYDAVKGNGQSRLLQVVRQALLKSYPSSKIRADGQIVKINFSDGMKFEILPAFKNLVLYGTYRYPDTNRGGNWKSTNPKAEQDAMKQKNKSSNGLLFDTCKHLRFIRDTYFRSYNLSGIVIDSFVYQAMGNWQWPSAGSTSSFPIGTYENVLLNFFNENCIDGCLYLTAPRSGDEVPTEKSLEGLRMVLNYIVN